MWENIRLRIGTVLAGALLAAGGAWGGVSVSDGVMTVDTAGKLSELLGTDDLAALTGNTVTNVHVEAEVTLDRDLASYTGGWTLKAKTIVGVNENAFGSGTDAAATIELANTSAILFVPYQGKAVVSNPIHIAAGNNGWTALYVNDVEKTGTSLTCNGKVTVEGNCKFHFQGTYAYIYFNGGLEQKTGTIATAGANGHWVVDQVPCTLNAISLSWLNLDLKVAGNRIGMISDGGGAKVRLFADGALVDGVTTLNGFGVSSQFFLNGHDVLLAGLKGVYATPIEDCGIESSTAAVFAFTNTTDITMGIAVKGMASLRKCGPGTCTLVGNKASSGALTVSGGTFAVSTNGVWNSCSKVTLDGGALTLRKGGALGTGTPLEVADATAQGVLKLEDGVTLSAISFKLGGTAQTPGIYGGAASDAIHKLAVFDASAKGLLCVENGLSITVDAGVTKTLSEALTADELATLKANGYTVVTKLGTGKLTLDEPLPNYTGGWIVSKGDLHVTAAEYGLGTTGTPGFDAVTVQGSSGGCLDLGVAKTTVIVKKPIVFTGNGNNKFNIWGHVEIEGLVSGNVNLYYILYGGDGALHFKGGFSFPGCSVNDNAANGKVYLYEPVEAATFAFAWVTLYLNGTGHRIGSLAPQGGGYYTLTGSDVFAAPPSLSLDGSLNSAKTDAPGTIDLDGHDLAIRNLGGSHNSVLRNRVATPVTVTMADDADKTVNSLRLEGPVSLVKGGPATFALDCGWTAAGALAVTNGTFAFLANGVWQSCTNVAVCGAAAALALNASTNLAPRVTLTVADGATIALAEGVAQEVGNVFRDGKPLAFSGTYGSAESPATRKLSWLTGKGVLVVHSSYGGTTVILR